MSVAHFVLRNMFAALRSPSNLSIATFDRGRLAIVGDQTIAAIAAIESRSQAIGRDRLAIRAIEAIMETSVPTARN